jgi:hypothetical protein
VELNVVREERMSIAKDSAGENTHIATTNILGKAAVNNALDFRGLKVSAEREWGQGRRHR